MRNSSSYYTLGAFPVTGQGLEISDSDLNEGLSGSVASIVFDDTGRSELEALMGRVAETQFELANLRAILSIPQQLENWRVGEAIAESYLTESKNCVFPWPDARDDRRGGSSLPGADLVGFHHDGTSHRFAFGEVKTSAAIEYPPGVMQGRHGLQQQLEDLRDRRDIRDQLVKYLGFRVMNTAQNEQFLAATKIYLNDPTDCRLFGFLVRDVPPHQDDLRVRVTRLRQACPASTIIELFALYLPSGQIAELSTRVAALRRNGGTP